MLSTSVSVFACSFPSLLPRSPCRRRCRAPCRASCSSLLLLLLLRRLMEVLLERDTLSGEEVRAVVQAHAHKADLERRSAEAAAFM